LLYITGSIPVGSSKLYQTTNFNTVLYSKFNIYTGYNVNILTSV